MAVNATGVFFGIKYAVPAMVANGGGSICLFAHRGKPGWHSAAVLE